MAQYPISNATEADIPSLSTIVPRSFHPSNDFFRSVFPDTPLVREWWGRVFLYDICDENSRVLTIFEESGETRQAIGMMLFEKGDGSEGLGAFDFTRNPPTADHDVEKFKAAIESVTPGFEKFTMGRLHFNIGLFGVDAKYQGLGLGKKLLDKACEISDAEGVDIFVQANKNASVFYLKRGFVALDEVVMPGTDGYSEVLLTYKPKQSR